MMTIGRLDADTASLDENTASQQNRDTGLFPSRQTNTYPESLGLHHAFDAFDNGVSINIGDKGNTPSRKRKIDKEQANQKLYLEEHSLTNPLH